MKKMMLMLGALLVGSAVFAADYPLTKWENVDTEGALSDLQENNFKFTATADYSKTGSKNVPVIGWIRTRCLPNGRIGVDMTKYNQFEFDLTVNSELDDIKISIYAGFNSANGKKDEICISQKFEPGKSYKVIVPIRACKRLDAAANKNIQSIQLVMYEKHLPDKVAVNLEYKNIRLTSGGDGMIKVKEIE